MGFRTFNPSKNSWNPEVYHATSEVDLAQQMSKLGECQAFFSETSPLDRATFLRFIREELLRNQESIQLSYQSESGLTPERFRIEWKRTLDTLELFAEYLEHHFQFEKVDHLENEAIVIRKKRLGIGPVLVLGSSNFPLAYSTIGGDSVSAFAAGCCVVVKAHPMHVGTSIQVAACVHQALKRLNFPEGIFLHVIDDGISLAQKLCADSRIQAVGFTGSFKGGKALLDIAKERTCPIPVFAEMGSCNPVILFEGISSSGKKRFAERISQSICNDAGQFCTKPGLIFIPSGADGDAFTTEIYAAMKDKHPVPMLHPDIFQNFKKRRDEILSISEVNSRSCDIDASGIEGAWTLAETNLKTFQSSAIMQEEVFGPFAILIRYTHFEELKKVLRDLPGQLTASLIYPEKTTLINSFIQLLSQKAGRIILNGMPTGVRVLETMHHGGPFPASSDVRFTAVGPDSISRFQKDVTIQEENISN